MTVRPLLLIDVDGVLNPHAARECPPSYTVHDFFGFGPGERVLLSVEHGQWLTSLADQYELIWATGWEHHANRLICPVLGLPKLPVIEFPPLNGQFVKLPWVISAIGMRACAWIDDMHGPDHHVWARERGIPTLLIDVDPSRGLQPDHIDQLRDWAKSLARN